MTLDRRALFRTMVGPGGWLLWPVLLVAQSPPGKLHDPIPKAWNDSEVEAYELPLSTGKRTQYMTSAEYYEIPARTIWRSYPVYRHGKGPRDYLVWLRSRRPQIAFDAVMCGNWERGIRTACG